VETKLARIAEKAKSQPEEVFTSLYHYLNKEMLLQCHQELSADKATGVDQVTKEEYSKELERNIESLVERLKKHSFKPQPVRRVYIPKDNGREKRPLGIPAYEDKIVQLGLKKILERIYEEDFLDFSYGFRPGRSCHDALIELDRRLMGSTNYVVDADIKGFFDNVSHEWLMKFIGVRIGDPNIKRLLVKFLKAGVMIDGEIEASDAGTPQGGIISPLLANVYLHYALDLWFEKAIRPTLTGEGSIVRYADDFVCCFHNEEDARRFYELLKERLAKFQLEIAEAKSKVIMFGRYAGRDRKAQGLEKPENFDFLGFTHYCSQSREGKFTVKRKTSKKKYKAKVKAFTMWIKRVRSQETIHRIFEIVKLKLNGHYNFYGITFNMRMMNKYNYKITKLLYKWLNRRSQRKSFAWEDFEKYLEINPLPRPVIRHRFTCGRIVSVR
jgi:group II intron reverse transcriptase/maturase